MNKSDPLERYIPLGAKIAVYILLAVYLVQAADVFYEYTPGRSWPFLLSAIRNGIFLFIHEGGHALFYFFGRTLNILGGSFWQIAFPLISFILAIRKGSHFIAPFALFWVGTNMMDVSLYMRDAPLRMLPLLGGHKSWHDWWNLFREWDILDSAGTWADLFYFSGLFVGIGAILWGIFTAVQRFRNPIPYKILQDETEQRTLRNFVVQQRQSRAPAADLKPSSPGKESENTFDGFS